MYQTAVTRIRAIAARPHREPVRAAIYAFVVVSVNLLIAHRLCSLEYSAQSIEGTFIAIARQVADHPGDLLWWPWWDCGLPFQNTYLPLLQLLVGGFARLTGHSAALSYHQVVGFFFCVAPLCLFLAAWLMTREAEGSFAAALVYSIMSPAALLLPRVAADLGSMWRPRRLQILVQYGEGPHTAALALLPLALLFLYFALTRPAFWVKVAAGVLAAATVLMNAFGATILAIAVLCLLAAVETRKFRRNLLVMAAIGVLAYCWICPLLPPSVISAIRLNSPTVEGDYRFNVRSLLGVVILAAGFGALWLLARAARWAPVLRFFAFFALVITGIVALGYFARIYVLPQPHRYQSTMDMSWCLLLVFAVRPLRARRGLAVNIAWAAALIAAIVGIRNDMRYARGLIRPIQVASTAPYKIAAWMDAHLHGQRVMIGGSYSFYLNDFTDTPQLHGGHEPMLPSTLIRMVTFQIYSGMNAGAEEGRVAALWLRALGVHAISVPGPRSAESYKPFRNPRKFEGVLPVVWHEDDDTIYAVPSRSISLAHVVPASAIVRDPPINGLDLRQVETYVNALQDTHLPDTPYQWTSRHSGIVRAQLQPGQAVSVQIMYHPGLHATVGGVPQNVRADGLGFLVVEPACRGDCQIELSYDGGPEWKIGCCVSILVMLFTAALGFRQFRWARAAGGGRPHESTAVPAP